MPADPDGLGGRLALYDPASLDADQQRFYDRCHDEVLPWADRAGFTAATDDGRLIGPFNISLLNARLGTAFLDWQGAEEQSTSLSARVREVVILTVGAVWRAFYELYAHAAVARSVGLSEDEVTILAGGGLPDSLNDEEQLAHRVALALTVDRILDEELYRDARATFGDDGIFDLINLQGAYQTVSAMLNAFSVPAPADDDSRR